VPTLVVAGSNDEAISPAETNLLERRIPGAELITLEGAAHLANLEQPEAFADAVLSHLLERM
jgi:3-oxoadipate enol-lactonase